METSNYRVGHIAELVKQEPYVGDDGIYMPLHSYAYENRGIYKMVISKEMFIEAYNKWIKDDDNEVVD